MDDELSNGEGYLALYGVLIVPAPRDESAGWFVTLATWSTDTERYVASTEGPLFETKAEALEEAERITDWLVEHDEQPDLLRAWELAQKQEFAGAPWRPPPPRPSYFGP